MDAWHANVQVQQGNGAGEAQAADAPLPTGRLLTYADITPALKGRQAEVGIGAFGMNSTDIVQSNITKACCYICAVVLARRQDVVPHRSVCHQHPQQNSQVSTRTYKCCILCARCTLIVTSAWHIKGA